MPTAASRSASSRHPPKATRKTRAVDDLATAPGFGLGYRLGDQPIRLTQGDVPIQGRVVDLEGRHVGRQGPVVRQILPPP